MHVTTRHLAPSSPFSLWRVSSVQLCATPAIVPRSTTRSSLCGWCDPITRTPYSIIRCQLFHCFLFSLMFLSFLHNHRHSCMHHIVTVVPGTIVPIYLFCSPVLPRHSGIHHTLHYARDYHSRTIVMQHRSTRHSWTYRTFHLVARNYCSRATSLLYNTIPPRHSCMQRHQTHTSTYTQHHLTTHLLDEPHHIHVCSQFMFHRILSFTVLRA